MVPTMPASMPASMIWSIGSIIPRSRPAASQHGIDRIMPTAIPTNIADQGGHSAGTKLPVVAATSAPAQTEAIKSPAK